MALLSLRKIRLLGPVRIDSYRSFGSPNVVVFRGRVLAGPDLTVATKSEHVGHRLLRSATRLLSREIDDVQVRLTVDGIDVLGITDDEGYYEIPLPITSTNRLVNGTVQVVGRPRAWPAVAHVIDPLTTRIIVSDVDDTLLVNGIGETIETIRQTITGSVLTREPVAGTPSLYRSLSEDGAVPFFYVSSSPWNLYDFLTGFLDHHDYPEGPLVLRDFGLGPSVLTGHGSHKLASILEICKLAPSSEVVLLGDSSQHDASAFAEVMSHYPTRRMLACIRDVGVSEKADHVREIAETVPLPHKMALVKSSAQIADAVDHYFASSH